MRFAATVVLLVCACGGPSEDSALGLRRLEPSSYPVVEGECTTRIVCYDPWATCPAGFEIDPGDDLGLEACYCDLVDGPYEVRDDGPCCYLVSTRPCDTDVCSDTAC